MEALGALEEVQLDGLCLCEGAEAAVGLEDGGVVDKDLEVAVVGDDEPIPEREKKKEIIRLDARHKKQKRERNTNPF